MPIEAIICEIALIVGGICFTHREERRERFPLRMGISLFFIILLAIWLSYYYRLGLPFSKGIVQLFSSIALLLFCYWNWNITFSVSIYYYVWVRVVWWFVIEISQFAEVAIERVFPLTMLEKEVLLAALFALVYGVCNLTISKWIPDHTKKSIGPRKLTSAILLCAVFELLAFMPELLHLRTESVDRAFVFFLLQWILAMLLYLQNELFRKSSMKQELELVTLLLQKEQEQYRLSKETIAIINQKCHDLKHQIRAVRQVSEEERDAYLKEVEDSVAIYESIVKTGNEVLDTILTEKSLRCRERQITISCVADGKLLSFLHSMDLYSLFGNAIDNAVEAVSKFEEPEKRQIDVLVYRQQNFLVVNIVNPIRESVTLEDGIPLTTKRNRNYHGFGMRSIRYIVKKYNGFFSITQEEGCFSLKILFPMQAQE